jgi:DNA-binding LytR/AlgR family response regulator
MCEASRMNKVLLHLSETRRRAVAPDDIFWVEAVGHDTLVRLRGSTRLRDTRKLGELLRMLEPHGFVRVHDQPRREP